MRSELDDIVRFEGNEEAFSRVLAATGDHEGVTKLVIYGPAGCGKTAVLKARGVEKDLLSTKKTLFTHAAELINAIKLETSEKLLNSAGSVDVLFIDSLDDFLADDEIGPDVCRLLVEERSRNGLDTVIGARKPLSAYDEPRLGTAFSDFEEIEVKPLDDAGRIAFARRMEERYREDRENAPTLSEEAVEYISGEFAREVNDIRHAVRFLVTAAGIEDGSCVSAELAKEALGS